MDLRAQLADLHAQSQAILDGCEADPQHRDLTEAERAEFDRLNGEFDRLRGQLDHDGRGEFVRSMAGTGRRSAPDQMDGAGGWGGVPSMPQGRGAAMYGKLFGSTAHDTGGFKSDREWFQAVFSGRFDPRLQAIQAAGMQEGTGSTGGYMVPTQLGRDLLGETFEASNILPLVRKIPLTTQHATFPRFAFEDRSVGLLGGFTGQWVGESQPGTVQTGEIVAINVTAHKLMIHSKASNELLADSAMFAEEFKPALTRALAYKLDQVMLRGNGAGQGLGVLNDTALLTVTAEGGQAADTFLFVNAVKMYAAMYAAGTKRAVWLVHPTVIPQLATMQNVVKNVAGTENVGGASAVTVGSEGQMTLLGRPVIQTEHLNRIGDLGDVVLADLSQYAAFIRAGISVETSVHAYWNTDEMAFKASIRMDSQGLWTEAGRRFGDVGAPTESLVRPARRKVNPLTSSLPAPPAGERPRPETAGILAAGGGACFGAKDAEGRNLLTQRRLDELLAILERAVARRRRLQRIWS